MSRQFYQSLLGCESAHGSDEYGMLTVEGKLLLQLYRQDVHEHPGMWKPETPPGNGVILWFRMDDFDASVAKVRALSPEIATEPHINPNAQQHEIWFRDPDGYLVVISDHMGDAKA